MVGAEFIAVGDRLISCCVEFKFLAEDPSLAPQSRRGTAPASHLHRVLTLMLNPTAYDTVSSPPTVNFIGLDVYIYWQSLDLTLFVIWYRRYAKKGGTAAAAEVAGMTGKLELEARTPAVQANHSAYNGDRVEIGGHCV